MDLDGGGGVVWGDKAPDLRRYVEGSATVGLRVYGLVKPLSPDEQLKVTAQAMYRFALPGSGGPSEGYLLFGVHESTASGYGFGIAIGPQLLGAQVGGLFLVQFSASWGLRYKNPVAESLASKPRLIPGPWMNLFYIDPVLEADGCVWTDPNPVIGRMQIKCVGTPDPKDPKTIVLSDGRRFAVGTHLWIRDDGMLITQYTDEVSQLDKQTADAAIAVQTLGHALHNAETREGKPCKFKADILNGITDPGMAAVLAYDDFGGAAALLGTELGRQVVCGENILSGAGILPLLGKGLRKGPLRAGGLQGHGDDAVHTAPATAPLDDKVRSHIYYGDVDKGTSSGWHYEPSADPKKGTYVIEGTRSGPDKHGVYKANVTIEGVKKKPYSSFFPKDWSPQQVEKAILEAYENRQPTRRPGRFKGITSTGMEIEMDVDAKGRVDTAYPLYDGG